MRVASRSGPTSGLPSQRGRCKGIANLRLLTINMCRHRRTRWQGKLGQSLLERASSRKSHKGLSRVSSTLDDSLAHPIPEPEQGSIEYIYSKYPGIKIFHVRSPCFMNVDSGHFLAVDFDTGKASLIAAVFDAYSPHFSGCFCERSPYILSPLTEVLNLSLMPARFAVASCTARWYPPDSILALQGSKRWVA